MIASMPFSQNPRTNRSPRSPLASTVGLEVSESVAGEPLNIRGSTSPR
jgi:hypothetical protein